MNERRMTAIHMVTAAPENAHVQDMLAKYAEAWPNAVVGIVHPDMMAGGQAAYSMPLSIVCVSEEVTA